MRKDENASLWYSPTDLVRYSESPYVTFMDRLHLEQPGVLEPDQEDAVLQALAEKGISHEERFRDSLREERKELVEVAPGAGATERTLAAIEARAEVIFQARLKAAPFAGYADFLVRSEDPDARCPYEIWDTKLASSVKPYYLIQLCCYAEMLEVMIGSRPETIGVVLGNGERVAYRTEDFFYYYLGIREDFLDQMAAWNPEDKPLPEPKADHGRWASRAAAYLEEVDHVVRVAGVTRSQMRKLEHVGITTLTGLAESTGHVAKLDPVRLERLREQARLQRDSAGKRGPRYRVVQPQEDDPRRGLATLPPASPMDIFFDMEGDPLLEGGLEYLFGATYLVDGEPEFWDAWAFDDKGEKRAFERFVDWVLDRWRQDPSMHVYHYAPYERTALKRLMGKYATREEEVDHLLRNDVLVDLYRVVKEGVRVGAPSYSLKDIEKLYMERDAEVTSAGESIVEFERFLASGESQDWSASPILRSIRDYNKDDCDSTWRLAEWLRKRQAETGIEYLPLVDEPPEDVPELPDEVRARRDLALQLMGEREGADGHVSELLGHLMEFHRRELKPVWWSFFERHEMTPEQHVEDSTCIGKATYDSGPIPIKRSQGYWYTFDPDQDTKLTAGDSVYLAGFLDAGMSIEELDPDGRMLIKVGPKAQNSLPDGMPNQAGFLQHTVVSAKTLEESIARVAEQWATRRELPQALGNLFQKAPPPLEGHDGGPLLRGEGVLEGTTRVVRAMLGATLCVQGPPGAGKTYTASHVIKQLLDDGCCVGVVSNGHEAVLNVMGAVNERCEGKLRCIKVGGQEEHALFEACPGAQYIKGGREGAEAYGSGLIGGSAWLFSHPAMVGKLDYLFVDEAGQFSLANLVATAPSTRNVVLLGDQMQLPQPLQGTHPGESGLSALEFALAGHVTVPDDLGIFLPRTWRLHPDICALVSEAFYEGRLEAEPLTAKRVLQTPKGEVDAGIRFCHVPHEGNTIGSVEEAEATKRVVAELLDRIRLDAEGRTLGAVGIDDILFVAPFNMQVRLLKQCLPKNARVASVDKFQGQEAPAVVVSLCRSAGESEVGGRGLEFVLNPNRLNVAVSRAQSLAVVVGDARIARGPARSVASMRQLNLLAKLLHAARALD